MGHCRGLLCRQIQSLVIAVHRKPRFIAGEEAGVGAWKGYSRRISWF